MKFERNESHLTNNSKGEVKPNLLPSHLTKGEDSGLGFSGLGFTQPQVDNEGAQGTPQIQESEKKVIPEISKSFIQLSVSTPSQITHYHTTIAYPKISEHSQPETPPVQRGSPLALPYRATLVLNSRRSLVDKKAK